MFKVSIIKTCSLFLLMTFSLTGLSHSFTCLPTCSNIDGRFLTFGGQFIDTFVFPQLSFGLGSPAGADTIEFGIFDAENGNLWDGGTGGPLTFQLFADPLGDTSGTFEVGTWTSDGVGGLNNGNPMPDNDWFNVTISNVPEAMAESGNYLYHMVVTNVDTNTDATNNFKFRTDGTLFIFPGDQPFGYEASARAQTAPEFTEVLDILYPNFLTPGCIVDPLCFDDPDCCSFSTYDGTFDFFFLNDVPERVFIDFWDGDLDFGPLTPPQGPPYEDNNDPNTPPGIPEFADAPNTNPQASAGASPPDDSASFIFVRPPNIVYSMFDPNGVEYPNNNPSATNEWELFQLNTTPGCAPDVCDIQVDDIPLGIWRVNIRGMDLSNLNFIRAFDKIVGVDDQNNPVEPLDPDPETTIPTMSEWGMLTTVILLGVIGFYYIKRRKTLLEN